MLQAMLKGKLSRVEEGMEDLLTSNTFGMMKYMPPEVALIPFLRAAINPLTGRSLCDLIGDATRVESWRFWPFLEYPECIPCEPDVEIVLTDGKSKRIVLIIEAKYRSGKSSYASSTQAAPYDQLARELDNLRQMARIESLDAFAVVYVTASVACPIDDIRASAKEYGEKRGELAEIFWLSWRSLPDVLERVSEPHAELATDLKDMLTNIGLTTFNRLRVECARIPQWQFSPQPHDATLNSVSWVWKVDSPRWGFGQSSQL